MQVPCYFHSKYRSSQSRTYKKNGLFIALSPFFFFFPDVSSFAFGQWLNLPLDAKCYSNGFVVKRNKKNFFAVNEVGGMSTTLHCLSEVDESIPVLFPLDSEKPIQEIGQNHSSSGFKIIFWLLDRVNLFVLSSRRSVYT